MVKYMEKLVMGSTPAVELNVEERNLLSVAHRVVVACGVANRVVD
jgi:14-3-3 protein epsilon